MEQYEGQDIPFLSTFSWNYPTNMVPLYEDPAAPNPELRYDLSGVECGYVGVKPSTGVISLEECVLLATDSVDEVHEITLYFRFNTVQISGTHYTQSTTFTIAGIPLCSASDRWSAANVLTVVAATTTTTTTTTTDDNVGVSHHQ
jgi:hypothetical protein